MVIWHLTDYPKGGRLGDLSFRSNKTEWEYDCHAKQTRALAMMLFSGNMGKGETVFSQLEPTKWESVVPDSFVQSHYLRLCGKK